MIMVRALIGGYRNQTGRKSSTTTSIKYNIARTPSPPPNPLPRRRDEDDDNAGGGGGSGWQKEVRMNDYGEYYYIDPDGHYLGCESQGNDIAATDEDRNKTAKPRGIILVFLNSSNQ